MVNHPYKELYWKPHIDKQIKIIGVDFWGYGKPTYKLASGDPGKDIGATYLDMENKEYYQMRNINPLQIGWEKVTENQMVIFKNSDIQWENFELTESLCSDSELRFGACESSSLKIRIYNRFIPVKNKWLWVTETLNGKTQTPFSFGVYKVFSDVPTADREYRDITAYDSMYEIINSSVIDWYNTILPNNDSEVTMKEFRTSFIKHFKLEQEDILLINDLNHIHKTIQVEDIEIDADEEQISDMSESVLSGKDVITAICEINGCFGHIGRDGKFQWVILRKDIQGIYPANDLLPDHAPDYMFQFPDGKLYPKNPESTRMGKGSYKSCKYEDFLVKKIGKVWIRKEEKDAGGAYGEGENCYIIENNFLVYKESAETLRYIARNILNEIKNIVYRPFEAECVGNPCLEVGDPVRLSTKYELIESYILKRTLKGIQSQTDSYSAEGEEQYSEKVNSVGASIRELKGKTNTLERNAERTVSKIENLESNTSTRFEQTENFIEEEVAARNEMGEEIKAHLALKIDKDDDGTIVSLINGTANKIHFGAKNMFTVSSPNFKINENGDVEVSGNITGSMITGSSFVSENGQYKTGIRGGIIETTLIHLIPPSEGGFVPGLVKLNKEQTEVTSSIYMDDEEIDISKKLYVTRGGGGSIADRPYCAILSGGRVYSMGAACPDSDDEYPCGTSGYKWTQVFATKDSISTSDENEKHDINEISEKYEKLFHLLEPLTYMFNGGDRVHIGTTAQRLHDAMQKAGISDIELSAFCKDVKMKPFKQENGEIIEVPDLDEYGNEQYSYGVRYGEFTMLNTHMIQKAYKKIEQQQEEIDSLKKSVSFLMERIGADYGSW